MSHTLRAYECGAKGVLRGTSHGRVTPFASPILRSGCSYGRAL
jgi:hypothetical protein